MIKRIIFFVLIFLYVYVTTFNIFLTEIIKVPAPILIMTPLLIFYRQDNVNFEYGLQGLIFFIAVFLNILIGESELVGFFTFIINLTCMIIFFNYIIGDSLERMMMTIYFFYGLLFISGVVLLLDHQLDIADIRTILIGGPVLQSPSGIATSQFTFGYQMAAVTPFMLIGVVLFKKNWLLSFVLIIVAINFIFFGMQRSVFVAFLAVVAMFLFLYFRAKSIFLFIGISAIFLLGQGYMDQFSEDKNQKNILNKNVKQTDKNENRGDLISENLKIIADYPFGLIFYNKTWNDVVQHNFVYKNGHQIISSHNGYLMFITYLGPILGLLLLVLIYYKVWKNIWHALKHIKLEENAMLVCLSFSFIAVSINSFFHNEWLLSTSGPTQFLYFSILHLTLINSYKIKNITY